MTRRPILLTLVGRQSAVFVSEAGGSAQEAPARPLCVEGQGDRGMSLSFSDTRLSSRPERSAEPGSTTTLGACPWIPDSRCAASGMTAARDGENQ